MGCPRRGGVVILLSSSLVVGELVPCRVSLAYADVCKDRMFRHAQSYVKRSRLLSTSRSSYAPLSKQLPLATTIPIDGRRRKLPNDVSIVEKKGSRKKNVKEDPSMFNLFFFFFLK